MVPSANAASAFAIWLLDGVSGATLEGVLEVGPVVTTAIASAAVDVAVGRAITAVVATVATTGFGATTGAVATTLDTFVAGVLTAIGAIVLLLVTAAVLVVRTATGAFTAGAFTAGAFTAGAFAFVLEGVATLDCCASAGEQTSKLKIIVPRILIRNE